MGTEEKSLSRKGFTKECIFHMESFVFSKTRHLIASYKTKLGKK